jgi:hypothetical protein
MNLKMAYNIYLSDIGNTDIELPNGLLLIGELLNRCET